MVLIQRYFRCIFGHEKVAHEETTVNLACAVDKDWRGCTVEKLCTRKFKLLPMKIHLKKKRAGMCSNVCPMIIQLSNKSLQKCVP